MDEHKQMMETVSSDKAQAEIAKEDAQGNVLRRHIIENPKKKQISKHRLWMDSVQHEYPTPYVPFKIGVYIRYFNQTRHKNYLEKHIQQFTDDIALCKRWTLVDFYIDKGMAAPHMEYSNEWCRLLSDCFSGKVDLIVTQKVSNVSSDPKEMAFIARILAAQEHPVGIYFISEDIFTLASYYRGDLFDREMFPAGWRPLPDSGEDEPMICGEPEFPLLPEDNLQDEDEGDFLDDEDTDEEDPESENETGIFQMKLDLSPDA